MSTVSLPFAIPRPVTSKVRRLRWLVRWYVAVEGLATVAIVLGLAFWLALLFDWLFEPDPLVRVLIWIVVIAATAWVAVRHFFQRAFARLSDSSLALVVERNYPVFQESLVTTIEAADRRRHLPIGNAAMLRHTSGAAAAGVHDVSLWRLFRWGPLAGRSGLAVALFALMGIFALVDSQSFAFWLERMQLTGELWPRRVQLSVVGFEEHHGERVVNVARDDNLELQVRASIVDEHVAPDQVEIRYERADGRRGRSPMIKVGRALPGRDRAQQFRYTFQHVASDLKFDLVGGDDRLRDLRIHVVARPQVERIVFDCEFPAYMDRAPRSVPVSSGRVELPEGTRAVCRVQATKPLANARVHDPVEQVDLPTHFDADEPQEFTFGLEVGREDRVLLVTVRDTEGVESHEPYRVVVSAIADLPPEVSVALRGIGTAITPQATIPIEGQVTDEYGLDAVWYEFQVDKLPAERRDLASQPQGSRKFRNFNRFDLALADPESKRRLVALSPGQKLTLSVQASDFYDLGDEPHVGSSQRFLLDVVTDSELRALLEKRELSLRQRFEAIYEKMVGTRELLDRIGLNGPDEEEEAEKRRRHQRDHSRIGGCLQNATQLSYETLGVADGFDDIVAELVNNRVDTEELKTRLEQGISEPLRRIGGELLPEWESSLQKLLQGFDENVEVASRLQRSKVRADEVVEAMKQVLDRMLELESYNELVDLLRGIVAEQKELREQTSEQRREKLRGILGNE
jgi:hypothetical protein